MTAAFLPREVRDRLERLAAENPSWGASLGLYEAALREAADPAWDRALLVTAGGTAAPLLAGGVLTLDAPRVRDWARRLTAAAGGAAEGAVAACARVDPLEAVAAAIRLDTPALERLATGAGALAETMTAFATLAAAPALAAAGRRLAGRAPGGWREGYCPICGAWPALAELRGVEGGRHLRCGRCGAGWEVEWLRCTYCGTADHRRLASLELEAEGDRRKVDTCAACRGYLKALPTLMALAPQAIVVEDLASVDLDLAALERGYARPGPPPCAPLELSVVFRARGWSEPSR